MTVTTMPSQPHSQQFHQHSVMERVLFQLHVRTCHFGLQLSTPARQLIEHVLLIVAIAGFGALIMLHRNFVSKAVCLDTIPNFNRSADLHHLTILPVSTTITHSYILSSTTTPTTTIDGTSTVDTCDDDEHLEPTFSYSTTKAYLLLPTNHSLLQYVPHIQKIVVSPHDPQCFGEPFLQYLVHNVIGYDTIVWNWFLHILQTTRDDNNSNNNNNYDNNKEAMVGYIASQGRCCHEFKVGPTASSAVRWEKWISKIHVLIKTTFLFFFSTTLISFTLRETQERMLEFTRELTRRVSIQLPLLDLVVFHLIHNVVFVPIMVGMLFFLIEFYSGDRMLAFLVMTIVWCVEVFSVISLRSYQGITFFPWMFFLLFCLFHIYYFANPYGFAYTALIVNGLFMVHSMVFFWHRYELPAVALGRVTIDRPRLQWDDTTTTTTTTTTGTTTGNTSTTHPLLLPEDPFSTTTATATTTNTNNTLFTSPHHHRQQQHNQDMSTTLPGPTSPPSQPHRIHHTLPIVEPEHHLLFARHASFSSHNSSSRNSTTGTGSGGGGSGGIFRHANDDVDDQDEDEQDYMYMLRGEVVVRRGGGGQGTNTSSSTSAQVPISSSSSSTQRLDELLEMNNTTATSTSNIHDDPNDPTTTRLQAFLDIPSPDLRVPTDYYSRDDSTISGLQSILEVRLTPRPSSSSTNEGLRPRSSPPPTLPNLPS